MAFFAPTPSDSRPAERVRAHYEVERELAARLRAASPQERSRLYGEVYDELFRRVRDHPQLTAPRPQGERWVAAQLELLSAFIAPATRFLEVGAGDCALSLALAARVRHVWALDVSERIVPARPAPGNVDVILSDGQSVPLEASSVDLAYSNQLMEHLHPDDARAQLRAIATALVPGGRYLCVTPHRFSGPHDISAFFDETATGFHLKEYTVGELGALMRAAGFRRVGVVVRARGRCVVVPVRAATAVEAPLGRLPAERRRRIARSPLRLLLGVTVIATK